MINYNFEYIGLSAMDIDHLLQFDIPDGVSTICIGGKIYTKEELEKWKSKKSKTKKVFKLDIVFKNTCN